MLEMQALFLSYVSNKPKILSLRVTIQRIIHICKKDCTKFFFKVCEKVMGLSLHEDCVLACTVSSGSEFGLVADVEKRKKLFILFSRSGDKYGKVKPT